MGARLCVQQKQLTIKERFSYSEISEEHPTVRENSARCDIRMLNIQGFFWYDLETMTHY